MLSLSRNVNQSIILQTSDGPVEVIIRQVQGQQVRVGIIADERINIVRKELLSKAPPPQPFEYY
jgi:carbon storage regulator CsrA